MTTMSIVVKPHMQGLSAKSQSAPNMVACSRLASCVAGHDFTLVFAKI
jgi:hypothetical protein